MKLTFEEHELIGQALKLINHKVSTNDYKFKNKAEMRKSNVHKVWKVNSEMKNLMEEILFMDYPEKARIDIYYGEIQDNR